MKRQKGKGSLPPLTLPLLFRGWMAVWFNIISNQISQHTNALPASYPLCFRMGLKNIAPLFIHCKLALQQASQKIKETGNLHNNTFFVSIHLFCHFCFYCFETYGNWEYLKNWMQLIFKLASKEPVQTKYSRKTITKRHMYRPCYVEAKFKNYSKCENNSIIHCFCRR